VAKKVHVIRIPASAQPDVTYTIAVVTKSPHQAAARALVSRLRSKSGQALLAGYGFLPLARGT